MTAKQKQRWAKAAWIARLAMGTDRIGPGRRHTVWRADEDPLAWWCLTELIHDLK